MHYILESIYRYDNFAFFRQVYTGNYKGIKCTSFFQGISYFCIKRTQRKYSTYMKSRRIIVTFQSFPKAKLMIKDSLDMLFYAK